MLDIADLVRDSVTVPCAFKAAAIVMRGRERSIERTTRRIVGARLRREKIISGMIDRIKELLTDDR